MPKPNVIVIGAGIGGIASAARLARQGYEVTVVEARERPGGRCGQLSVNGHRFDTGPTLYLMPEIYAQSFADLGARIEDYLDLRRIDPSYQLHFSDGSSLALTSDLQAMQEQLETMEPGSYPAMLRYLEQGQHNYTQAMQHLVQREFRNLAAFVSPRTLALLFKLKALKRHYRNVGDYFSDPRLKAAFTFQDMYMGLSPFEAPALYSLLQYIEFADGIWYPMGGMYRVIEALVEQAMRSGVRFLYRSPVKEICVQSDRATGVKLSSGVQFPADLIVANADLSYVYRRLLPDDGTASRLDRKRYGCSALVFYWGLRKRYPQLGVHNLFLAEDYRQSFDPIFKQLDLPEDPSFYVHAPARVDPAAAPAGRDSLMVALPIGHLDRQAPQNWNRLAQRARNHVLSRLHRLGLTDLEDSILFERRMTPHDWHGELNLTLGSTHGLSHNLTQMGYLRPHNRHARIRNLYFTGASTHPGTGMPTVLISAKLAADRILRELPIQQAGSAPERTTAFSKEAVRGF